VPNADRIREEFIDISTNDANFVEYITSTTDKPDRIRYRADQWKRRLEDIIGSASREPRCFTLQLKTSLFDADPTCRICAQRIQDIDDAEVDHIEHYWRGGKTIPENARLTHRYCNRSRGGREDQAGA
jgi:5-methylcytosine-specific restriction endonuclease McrA